MEGMKSSRPATRGVQNGSLDERHANLFSHFGVKLSFFFFTYNRTFEFGHDYDTIFVRLEPPPPALSPRFTRDVQTKVQILRFN